MMANPYRTRSVPLPMPLLLPPPPSHFYDKCQCLRPHVVDIVTSLLPLLSVPTPQIGEMWPKTGPPGLRRRVRPQTVHALVVCCLFTKRHRVSTAMILSVECRKTSIINNELLGTHGNQRSAAEGCPTTEGECDRLFCVLGVE